MARPQRERVCDSSGMTRHRWSIQRQTPPARRRAHWTGGSYPPHPEKPSPGPPASGPDRAGPSIPTGATHVVKPSRHQRFHRDICRELHTHPALAATPESGTTATSSHLLFDESATEAFRRTSDASWSTYLPPSPSATRPKYSSTLAIASPENTGPSSRSYDSLCHHRARCRL